MNYIKRLKNIVAAIKRYFINFLNKIVLKKYKCVIRTQDVIVLEEMLKIHTRGIINNNTAECIVFSMDRAFQLHALISTYFEKVKNPIPMYILWRASSKEHKYAYNEVFNLFSKRNVYTIFQKSRKSFKSQLMSILANMEVEKIFFLVDDILFINDVDMLDFLQLDASKMVASLRLGLNINRHYTINKEQYLPPFIENNNYSDKMMWVWKEGKYSWGFPLSLDGNVFLTKEIYLLSKYIDFYSPTTYEANLQKYLKYFTNRMGICYKKSKIFNIPANKVQKDWDSLHSNNIYYHQDELLKAWNKGLQMNYEMFYGFKNQSAHQIVGIKLKKRNNNTREKK